MPSSLGSYHGHSMALHWCFSLKDFHGILPCLAHWDITMAIPWRCSGASHWGWMPWHSSIPSSLGSHHGHSMVLHWCFSLGGLYGSLPSLALWDLTIALVLLIRVCEIPQNSSMPSSLGSHQGHSMALHWCFSLRDFQCILPCLAHWDITMAIPWHCSGASHWVDSMEFFHP